MDSMKLIGMSGVKSVLSDIVKDRDAYKRGKARVPNMIIMINPGNGQTYTTETITDILVKYELREFCGLDEYLEYKLDGSKASIDMMFADINDNAIYENYYKGVVSVDISELASVINQYQMKTFEEKIKKVADNATVILYCSTKLGSKGEKLVSKLENVLDNVRIIDSYVFTPEDYVEIILQNIKDRGIIVEDEEKNRIISILRGIISNMNIGCAKDAMRLAERLVFYADYTKDVPNLNYRNVENFILDFGEGVQV